MLVPDSIVLTLLNSFLIAYQEVRVCTNQRTISAYVLYYSKFDQEVNAFM